MLIRISGVATISRDCGQPLTPADLQELDGATSEDTCVDYLDEEPLADLGLTGGAVKLVRGPDGEGFRVVTEYGSATKLRPAVLRQLADATAGQWSDGIGEGCFDELAERLGVTINLVPLGRPVAEQIDDGKKVPRPSKSVTALAKAVEKGDLDAVCRLLDAGADPDAPHQGFTPLILAILAGRADIALELIVRGAGVLVECRTGDDPLMNTALANRLGDEGAARVARVLLERGADPHRPRGEPSYGGPHTPLYLAENRKKRELAKVLREFGAVK